MGSRPGFWLYLTLATLVVSLPLAVVLAVLVGHDGMAPGRAVTVWLFAGAGVGALLYAPLRGLGGLRSGLERLAEGEPGALPRVMPGFDWLLAPAARLRRRLQELQAAAASQGRMADTMLDTLLDPVLTLDDDGRILRGNRAAAALFGAALPGRPLPEVLRSPELIEAVEEVQGGAASRSIDLILPHPVERDFECRVAPLVRDDGRLTMVVLKDRTDARRAEQMRVDFVANASHEIRTPLATLTGCIETLQGPAADDVAARERFLALMAQQADRMTRLVQDLLSLSRIEMNEHRPPDGDVDLLALVRRAAEALRLKARDIGVELKIRAEAESAHAIGAADELEQVFLNLIDNAIKYGRDGHVVEIVVSPAPRPLAGTGGGALAVAVRDHGPGIARQHLPRLTERFFRVDTARSRELGGTGLGLAIVKHIVNRHRGVLLIDSVVGQGSTFTVLLPARPDDSRLSAA
jgi:two-component system phosphate regulon sensor histidine kinase PhoR